MIFNRNPPKYIGETSRTLAERSTEHVTAAEGLDADNFIVKHWVSSHPDLTRQPRMRFKVRKSFTDPLSRLVTEAVLIEREGKLNSKSEWGHNKLKRLTVDKPEWMRKKEMVIDASASKEMEAGVTRLREKVCKKQNGASNNLSADVREKEKGENRRCIKTESSKRDASSQENVLEDVKSKKKVKLDDTNELKERWRKILALHVSKNKDVGEREKKDNRKKRV